MIKKKITIANENNAGSMDDGDASPDHVRPFMLETSSLRGRIVRLPGVVDEIIRAHGYPDPIARLLAEALCLTTLLAGMLKFNGVFTLQAKGNAIIRTLVTDMTNEGVLRGTATFNTELLESGKEYSFKELMGEGYLAFTVDQANSDERTQGIVPLEGDTLTACVRNYFQQSEQIDTSFVCFVEKKTQSWNGGAMMLQNLARLGGHDTPQRVADDDEWQRALTLMHSVKREELLDAGLPLNGLLYRLFHEEGVRVFDPITIMRGCRCSPDKIKTILANLSVEEKREYSDDGMIAVTCEFCNTTYRFPVEES